MKIKTIKVVAQTWEYSESWEMNKPLYLFITLLAMLYCRHIRRINHNRNPTENSFCERIRE